MYVNPIKWRLKNLWPTTHSHLLRETSQARFDYLWSYRLDSSRWIKWMLLKARLGPAKSEGLVFGKIMKSRLQLVVLSTVAFWFGSATCTCSQATCWNALWLLDWLSEFVDGRYLHATAMQRPLHLVTDYVTHVPNAGGLAGENDWWNLTLNVERWTSTEPR